MSNYYITTPIFYPSGPPHIGHLYTMLIADTFKRFQIQRDRKCIFAAGFDVHGAKILNVAEKANTSLSELIKLNKDKFLKLWEIFDIKYDYMTTTSDVQHVETVKNIINILNENNSIYEGTYSTNYCIHCEEYFTDFASPGKICLNCKRLLKPLKEKAFFLKTKKYSKQIKTFYDKNKIIYPNHIKKELFNNFLTNFYDLCITRYMLTNGISFLDKPNYTIYVWIDALLNYISACGYYNNKKNKSNFWDTESKYKKILIIGKEISRFHALYFWILLKCLNLDYPERIICHGWITNKSSKISKSKNNMIDINNLLNRWSPEVIRYSLLKNNSIFADMEYHESMVTNTYNNDLVNNIGNLFYRVNSMYIKYKDNLRISEYSNEILGLRLANTVLKNIKFIYKKYINYMNLFFFNKAINVILELSTFLNKLIETVQPWVLNKNSNFKELNNFFYIVFYILRIITKMIKPFLEETSSRIQKSFFFTSKLFVWDTIIKKEIEKIEILFPKENSTI